MKQSKDIAGPSWDKNMPLLLMTKEQLEATFDSLGSDLDQEHLDGVRAGRDQAVVVAVLFLFLVDGTRRIVLATCEYGDGEGLRFVDDEMERIKRCGSLKKGERVERYLYRGVIPE